MQQSWKWILVCGALALVATSAITVEAIGKRPPHPAPGAQRPAPSGVTHPHQRVAVREGWFYVDGERFFIKGIGYSPTRPGKLP